MRFFLIGFLVFNMLSCDKVIDVELPAYNPQLVMEMYLEVGKPLRCLISESLPYTDTAINRPVENARVIFSDGLSNDTLRNMVNNDIETGRWFNYFNPRVILEDSTKTYTIKIEDFNNRVITGKARFSDPIVRIKDVATKQAVSNIDTFSVGVIIADPPGTNNYYRFLITKKLNDFHSDPADFSVSDNSFNGSPYSFFSEPNFARNDTVVIRVYSLQKEHYDYIQSTDEARSSNYNPFAQPARIKSNVNGGVGIFTTIRFDQREIIIR